MIRKYRSADLEDLLNIWAAASALAHPSLSKDFLELERHNIPRLYLPNAETWVWETNGRVVGFTALIGNEVGAIFVDPSCHRNGIGRALMDRARALRGELEVEAFKANSIGRAFYERYGFELIQEKTHEPSRFEVLRLRMAANGTVQTAGFAADLPFIRPKGDVNLYDPLQNQERAYD